VRTSENAVKRKFAGVAFRAPGRRSNVKGFVVFRSIDQGEAEAEGVAVAVVSGALFSGARTVFSSVTVRAGGTGGAAPPRSPPTMRPRKNPKSSPKSSPTASVRRNALAGPGLLLAVRMSLLLPMVLFPHRRSVPTHWAFLSEPPEVAMPYPSSHPARIVDAPCPGLL